MAAPQTEVLITVDGSERGRFLCAPGDYVIGRNPDCHIRVEADLVSRRHAKLVLNYDHALIEDLGSSNGTRVNGQPVTEATRLWPNQKIQVGAATIELRRLKVEVSDQLLMPTQAVVRRVPPEEFLREKKYDIGKVVAQGGMGAILDAKEATTDRTIAMKVMRDTNDPDALMRFLNEAKLTAQLEHPNIVPVHELNVECVLGNVDAGVQGGDVVLTHTCKCEPGAVHPRPLIQRFEFGAMDGGTTCWAAHHALTDVCKGKPWLPSSPPRGLQPSRR